MITKISIAALAVLALAAPVAAQDLNSAPVWAPWSTSEPAPAPQVRVAPVVQRIAIAAPQAEPTPVRTYHFERFWVVGSFR